MEQYQRVVFLMMALQCGATAAGCQGHSHDYDDRHLYHSVAGGSFLQPFEHIHSSTLGTPIVHSFGVEAAFTGRDLFSDYRYRDGADVEQHELSMELEWAFTRRLGIIVELPYLMEKSAATGSSHGVGDLALVPRVILLEKDRFTLTAQLEITLPTGGSDFGGETAIAPGLAAWFDLGGWWTLNAQAGVEHGFDADSTEFNFGFGLVKSFNTSSGKHPSMGPLNLHIEVTGAVGVNGSNKGDVNLEGLIGVSYGLSSTVDMRLGYEFPLTSPNDFDGGLVSGLIWHF